MSAMVLGIATRRWPGWSHCVQSWVETAEGLHQHCIVPDRDVLVAYQQCVRMSEEPICGFIHDDVMIYEKGWDTRVLNCFRDTGVGLAGFGGALGHGTPNLYTGPYRVRNLARQHFMSNMRSAEKHGSRFAGECDVAVLDAFAVFVRRSILEKWGGFPIGKPVGYYMWCENLCCETRRQGHRIRLVGVDCEHIGGRTSSSYPVKDDYDAEHRYFYQNNRDVMPYRVKR
jgi:hypothetical protein